MRVDGAADVHTTCTNGFLGSYSPFGADWRVSDRRLRHGHSLVTFFIEPSHMQTRSCCTPVVSLAVAGTPTARRLPKDGGADARHQTNEGGAWMALAPLVLLGADLTRV